MRDVFSMLVGVVIFAGGFLTSSALHHLEAIDTCPLMKTCCPVKCDCEKCECCQGCCK